ncbi:metallophosphoesterase [Pseudochryseolinea flava]|uniref:Metallophosphoesterase n=1 Tax=Pseudochryseolinea flava TaxID=2059302 RepID=A0A364Y5X5_9BACT|nr:metallophosphoesterase [Pseudochryseolinea flava]RAW01635.1 metallophosphoesterase [Pseudochryseolinea flava]
MKARIMVMVIALLILLAIDYYVFQAVLVVSKDWTSVWRNVMRIGFWVPTVLSFSAIAWWAFGDQYTMTPQMRTVIFTSLIGLYFSKIFGVLVLFAEDVFRGMKWVVNYFYKGTEENLPGVSISRSEFISKAALVASAIPFGTMAYGIISGAHDYRVRRKTIYLPNLPKAFDGIRLGQISDIHSGSFFNKTAVKGGVEMMMQEKPDLIMFTGDLVNNEASEVKDYINIFDKFKAPLGVYSVTGNHDYGDYVMWKSKQMKQDNFNNLIEAHRLMGFDLLMNENRFVEIGGEKLAIIGIENWGGGRFAKYGKLDEAYKGTEEAATKILLSHDPSHWDAQVLSMYPDIDLALAGHTHGFQFGVEIGDFKWSPSQYAYKQWAGLYQTGSQYLYVNRGFGYLGYPGRVGMPPELTILELKRA